MVYKVIVQLPPAAWDFEMRVGARDEADAKAIVLWLLDPKFHERIGIDVTKIGEVMKK